MKLIVTGASGFVGQKVSTYFSNLGYTILPLKVRWETVQSVDVFEANAIIHTAGIAHDLKGENAATEYFNSNYKLSIQLIDKFLQSNCQDFIYLSSIKALSDESSELITEQTKATPSTDYGKSKKAVEDYIATLEIPQGKRIFILRPSMIYGENCKGNLPLLYRFLKKGIPYPLGAYQNRRSFLNVKNLLFILQSLIENKAIAADDFLVADDKSYSSVELIKYIGEIGNIKTKIFSLPKWLINAIVKMNDNLRLPFNTAMLSKLTSNYFVDNAKLKSALQIQALPFDLKAGIKDMIDKMPNKQ